MDRRMALRLSAVRTNPLRKLAAELFRMEDNRTLQLRFGPMDETIGDQVRKADAEILLQWGEKS
jgi:hypothetical protein